MLHLEARQIQKCPNVCALKADAREHLDSWQEVLKEAAMIAWIVTGLSYIIVMVNLVVQTAQDLASVYPLTPRQRQSIQDGLQRVVQEAERRSMLCGQADAQPLSEDDKARIAQEFAEKIAKDVEKPSSTDIDKS